MNSQTILSALFLAHALVLSCCQPILGGDEGSSGPASSTGNENNGGVRRVQKRIGNFKGGHLGASSFGDGSPGQAPLGPNVPTTGFNGMPGGMGFPGGGFGGGNGFGGFGPGGTLSQGGPATQGSMTPPAPGPSDPSNSSTNRVTIGSSGRGDNDSMPRFPTRFGNTELRQWEVGASVPWDPAYAYWANWGTNAGLLMEFGWGFPFLGMGMGGMMSPFYFGGNSYYGAGGFNPTTGYGYPGSTGVNGTAGYDPYGTNGSAINGTTSSATIGTYERDAGAIDRPTVDQPPQPESPPQPGSRGTVSRSASVPAASPHVNSEKGEAEFRAGHYKDAAYYWKHALIDDPKNGLLAMLVSQALFASGQYNEAATATQTAMRLLPEDRWNVVVANRRELYGEPRDYLDQLLALDRAAKARPTEPALRFLSGFHYACLGYPKAALYNLEKSLKLAPQDELALRLRNEMQSRLTATSVPAAPIPPVPHSPASSPAEAESDDSSAAEPSRGVR